MVQQVVLIFLTLFHGSELDTVNGVSESVNGPILIEGQDDY